MVGKPKTIMTPPPRGGGVKMDINISKGKASYEGLATFNSQSHLNLVSTKEKTQIATDPF